MAPTFLGLTCVTFRIGRIIPIDPVLAIVGDKASRAKIILSGELKKKVKVEGVPATKGAKAAIESAGGSVADIVVREKQRKLPAKSKAQPKA